MPLIYLMVVLFSCLAIATPFLTLFLLVRQARLRREFNELSTENEKRFTKLQRIVGDLQSKLAATGQPGAPADQSAPAAEKPVSPEAHQQVPVPRSYPVVPTPVLPSKEWPGVTPRVEAPLPPKPPQPAAPTISVTEKKPELTPEQKPLAPPPAMPVAPPVIPAATQPPEPPVPAKPLEPKPLAPAPQTPPVEPKPVAPTAPPKAVPPPAIPHPPVVPVTPPHAATVPPAAAARVSMPPTISPLRTPAHKKTFQQRMNAVSALEETLGANWFAKLGGIMIVIGVVIIGVIKLANLGAFGKVAISYLVALLLLLGGIYLERRERYQLFGRVGIGCGWALLFFTTYAIRNIAAMHVVDSAALDCVLMLAVALGMAAHTLRYKSQYVTGLAFLLGYTTIALSFSEVSPSSAGTSESTVYGLLAGAILAIGLVAIVNKLGWFELEVFGILSSYLNHLYWLYHLLGPNGAHGRAFPEYHASLAMLFFYWLTFRISYILRGVKTDLEEHVSTVAALLNTLLLLGVMKFQSVQPELAYIALLTIGALEFSFAQLPTTRRRRRAFIILSLLGAALMIVAVPSHFSGDNVAYLWLVGAEIFLFAGIIFKEVVFRRVGLLTGILVGIDLFGFNFRPFVDHRAKLEDLVLDVGILFGLCAIVFCLNALYIGSRWKDHFTDSLDSRLLDVQSYFGAAAATTAAWALFTYDWTALAFAAIMLLFAALGRRLESRHIQIQYALLGALTLYRAVVFNFHVDSAAHSHITTRLITLPILGAIFYLTAKLTALRNDQEQRFFRGLFDFAGTALFAALIWYEVPELWRPLAFIAFAVALSESARALRYYVLAAHAHVVTLLALFTAFTADEYNIHVWHTIPVHAFAALPVVAGCYLLAKRLGTENARHLEIARLAYTWLAAGVMVWILEEAFRARWIAVAWIAFAVALALCPRWIRYRQFAWQASAVALAAFIRTYTFNLNLHDPLWRHVSLRLFSVSLVIAGAYVLAKIAAGALEESQSVIRNAYTWVAAFFVGFLIWGEAPYAWIAVFFLAAGIILALIARRWNLLHLGFQAHLFAICSFVRTYTFNLNLHQPFWRGVSLRLLTVGLVIIGAYVLAKIGAEVLGELPSVVRNAYTWVAAFFVGILIWYEAPYAWIAVFFLAAGIILALVGRRWNLPHLGFQEHLFAIAAVARTFDYNYHVTGFYGHLSLRIITVSLVAAGLYAISRKATQPDAPYALASAYLHTTAATSLLALLMWYEATTGWLAAFWALFAFALTLVDRRFKLDDLRWQAHVLAALAMIRSVAINMYVEDTWHGVSVRLLSLSIVAVVFYAMTRITRMPEELRARDFHHIYSWSASFLVSLLLWHELQPLSIAVGLATFGLVLFEYGFLRKIKQFRFQAYVAFVAAFARIFFANLAAGEQGELFGPRMYTVFPLILIFFFVYAQLSGEQDGATGKLRVRWDSLVAYLGTAALVALFYFEFPFEWVVTAYAALAFLLFGAAWALHRPIFLHQGIFLTLGTFARGMAYNLFGSTYFGEGDWTGRYFVVGSAVATLLATLLFAFPLRGRYVLPPNSSRWKKIITAVVARPEQLQFFLPIILLTTMLALKTHASMVTVSWGIEGVFIVVLALAVRERSFRLAGFGILILCVLKVFAMDVWRQHGVEKGITIVVVGTALVAVSLLYVRFGEKFKQYL